MTGQEQQRHLTDCALYEEDSDHDDETPGTMRTRRLPDPSQLVRLAFSKSKPNPVRPLAHS